MSRMRVFSGNLSEKCNFENLHYEIKCVLSITESNFNNKKMEQNFHICLRSGPMWVKKTMNRTQKTSRRTPKIEKRRGTLDP